MVVMPVVSECMSTVIWGNCTAVHDTTSQSGEKEGVIFGNE